MATSTQRKRRMKRRHDHQAKTSGKVAHAVVQHAGITHIFPTVATATEAFVDTKQTVSTEHPAPSPAVVEDLSSHSVEYLRNPIASGLNIRGRTKMKKADLIAAILEAQANA